MKHAFSIFLIFMGASLIVLSCGGKSGSADSTKLADSAEAQVKQVCTRCHEWIPPDMLDKTTWRESVLPVMAAKMGIYEMDGKSFFNEKNLYEIFYILLMNEDVDELIFIVSNNVQVGLEA